ncbi:CENP-Q, a CENPA-CAD centromere complex subunit-domain-containing protein [Hypoxylon crocopeplum]|nr:CENP-Q, a CENPA-CAD centromere complex subunit-domain-containing protein [Hypoxylon crocopeplum]
MAPEAANQKRKRGRPTNASRDEGDASGSQLQLTRQGQLATTAEGPRESDMDESSRPRKRGRPANTEAPSQAQPEPEASQPQRAKRKLGPSPALQTNGGRDYGRGEAPETTTERRKRGRPRLSRTGDEVEEVEEHAESAIASQNAPPRKRGRPPKEAEAPQDNEVEAEEADDENEGNSSILRRSSRVRRSPVTLNKGAQETAKVTIEQASSSQKQKEHEKGGRPPLRERPVNETEQEPNPQPKKKRGRPSLNSHPPEDAEQTLESQGQPKKRGRPSLSGENATSTKEKGKKPRSRPLQDQEEARPGRGRPRLSNEAQPNPRNHRRSSGTQDRSSSPDSAGSPPPYRHLTTRTHRIPRNVIEAKWTPLEAPAISSVASLLQSASRPVLLRLRNPQRHAHAASALNAVSKRLRSKVARGLPFPPATTSARREDEFEFERAISGIQGLEAQLDPLLHGVELLKREKERAEMELENEYKVLARLGSNARAEARERRERVRKMHVLVPEKPPEVKPDEQDGGIVAKGTGSGGVFADLQDEELTGLAGQIADHMESMRGNLQQIDGVVPAIARSRGLLRAALQSHLDREQLENVILG